MSDSRDDLRLERVVRGKWIVWTSVLLLVASGAAFLLGMNIRSPESQAISAATVTIPATAEVEIRQVSDVQVLQGAVEAGAIQDVHVGPVAGASIAVVTSAIERGSAVGPGTLLGSVSDRPLIAIPLPVAMYRSLAAGDAGDDVRRLQTALREASPSAPAVTGKFDRATRDSVRALYAAVGFSAPKDASGSAVFTLSEFVAIPVSQASVLSVEPVGTVLKDAPFIRIQVSPNVIVAKASVIQVDEFAAETTVRVSAGPDDLDAVVLSADPFTPADPEVAGSIAGHRITVSIPADAGGLEIGQPVTLSTTSDDAESLAVPSVAVRQSGSDFYVVVVGDGKEATRTEVAVDVLREAGGWVAIAENQALTEGTVLEITR